MPTPDQERSDAMDATIQAFGPVWTVQGMRNLPSIAANPTVAKLKDRFAGVPAVVIASGPSLAKNVHLLRELKGRAVLMAFGRSLQRLQQEGITPDVSVALDPLDLVHYYDGYPVPDLEAVVLGMTSNPGHYQMGARRTFTFSGNNEIEGWIWHHLDGPLCHLDTSCSVATTTTSLALLMGCDPIVYVGQDLALSGGKYWADGTVDGNATMMGLDQLSEEETHDRRVMRKTMQLLAEQGMQQGVTGIQMLDEDERFRREGVIIDGLGARSRAVEATGRAVLSRVGRVVQVPANPQEESAEDGTVPTTPSFSWVREWIGKRAGDHPGRMWNCTEGGALLDGMEHLPLADAIKKLPAAPVDVGARFDAAAQATDVAAQRAALRSMAWRAAKSCRAAQKAAQRLTKHLKSPAKTPRQMRRLAKAELAMLQVLQTDDVLLSLVQQTDLHVVHERAKASETPDATLEVTRVCLESLLRACEMVLPAIRDTLVEMEQPPG